MKKFKKSEIAIYAIALMLVTAGYFNYTTFEKKTEETYSEDVGNIDSQYANVGDAVLVSNNETQNTSNEASNNTQDVSTEPENNNENDNNKTENNEQNGQTEVSSNEQNQNTQSEENKTIDTNSSTNSDETNYYVSSKLDRDKMYAEMVSNYEKILNNSNASETQKSIVAQEITKINNTKNSIMICENLISTKGFENCVIFVNDKSVNVVVKVEGGLSTEKVAKVQNIISRELGTEIENIHITEK